MSLLNSRGNTKTAHLNGCLPLSSPFNPDLDLEGFRLYDFSAVVDNPPVKTGRQHQVTKRYDTSRRGLLSGMNVSRGFSFTDQAIYDKWIADRLTVVHGLVQSHLSHFHFNLLEELELDKLFTLFLLV